MFGIFAIFVTLAAAVTPPSVAGPLGERTVVNEVARVSCATDYAALSQMGVSVNPDSFEPPNARAAWFRLGNSVVKGASHPEATVGGFPIVYLPHQEFLVPIETNSVHKIVANRVILHGFYGAWTSQDSMDPYSQWDIANKYLPVMPFSGKQDPQYLVPIDVLLGLNSPSPQTPQIAAVAPVPHFDTPWSEGIVETKGGSVYVFGPGSRVDVFSGRPGASPSQTHILNAKAAFSSHSEILRRQGVLSGKLTGNAEADLVAALNQDARAFDQEIKASGAQALVYQTWKEARDRTLSNLRKQKETGGYFSPHQIFDLEPRSEALLKPERRWIPLDQTENWTTSTIDGAEGSIRSLHRFIGMRRSLEGDTAPAVRVLNRTQTHSQQVQWYFGEAGLELAKDGWFFSGVLAVERDPHTGAISSMRVEDNGDGMLVPGGDPSVSKPTPEEIAQINASLALSLPVVAARPPK